MEHTPSILDMMLPIGIRLLFLLSEYSYCICESDKTFQSIIVVFSQNVKNIMLVLVGVNFPQIFKLTNHTAWSGPEIYNQQQEHERSRSNDQRQIKKYFFQYQPVFFQFMKKSTTYCYIRCYSCIYTRNILTAETATGYQSVTSCRVWELEMVLFLFYYQSLALGFERPKIRKPIFIVLIKPFTVN